MEYKGLVSIAKLKAFSIVISKFFITLVMLVNNLGVV
ncbi:hypothetical protein WPAUFG295_09220 [Wolbachia pipientis]